MREDYYATLGVDPGASPKQIEAAFRRLARQYHPDLNPAPDAATRMRAINAAYQVLRDPLSRVEYDRSRSLPARVSVTERTAEWEQFAAWEAQVARRAAPTPPRPHVQPRMSVSLRVGIGVALVALLA